MQMTSRLREYMKERKIYIVHRLDKNTSGNLMVCKSKKAAQAISSMFVKRDMLEKNYLAIVRDVPKSALRSGVLRDQITRNISYDKSKNKAIIDRTSKSNC